MRCATCKFGVSVVCKIPNIFASSSSTQVLLDNVVNQASPLSSMQGHLGLFSLSLSLSNAGDGRLCLLSNALDEFFRP